jgi:hypothetical protein
VKQETRERDVKEAIVGEGSASSVRLFNRSERSLKNSGEFGITGRLVLIVLGGVRAERCGRILEVGEACARRFSEACDFGATCGRDSVAFPGAQDEVADQKRKGGSDDNSDKKEEEGKFKLHSASTASFV